MDGLPRGAVRIEWMASPGTGSIEPDAVLSDEGGLYEKGTRSHPAIHFFISGTWESRL